MGIAGCGRWSVMRSSTRDAKRPPAAASSPLREAPACERGRHGGPHATGRPRLRPIDSLGEAWEVEPGAIWASSVWGCLRTRASTPPSLASERLGRLSRVPSGRLQSGVVCGRPLLRPIDSLGEAWEVEPGALWASFVWGRADAAPRGMKRSSRGGVVVTRQRDRSRAAPGSRRFPPPAGSLRSQADPTPVAGRCVPARWD